MSTKVYGASDDLIEFEGDVYGDEDDGPWINTDACGCSVSADTAPKAT